MKKAQFHLPGLFEFHELYQLFLPLLHTHAEYFYPWASIASIYGAPADAIWSGGRLEQGDVPVEDVLRLLRSYGISARLTFSNSLLNETHLGDAQCNALCDALHSAPGMTNGVIVHSELLLSYLRKTYPHLYYVSSTTKVLTQFDELLRELSRNEFRYVVPDFRWNHQWEKLQTLSEEAKDKMEFLCNECCFVGCTQRKICYENVSRRALGENCAEHQCMAPEGAEGYVFSKAMRNASFIGTTDIVEKYLPAGFTNFKIEGRSLGSAVVLEMLLYYLIRPEYHLQVREAIYLSSSLDLF